jgi:hypothetical protein
MNRKKSSGPYSGAFHSTASILSDYVLQALVVSESNIRDFPRASHDWAAWCLLGGTSAALFGHSVRAGKAVTYLGLPLSAPDSVKRHDC